MIPVFPTNLWIKDKYMAKFAIYNDRAGQYRWRLIANNGEIVAASEAYTSKQNAIESVSCVKRLGPSAETVDETTLVKILAGLLNK